MASVAWMSRGSSTDELVRLSLTSPTQVLTFQELVLLPPVAEVYALVAAKVMGTNIHDGVEADHASGISLEGRCDFVSVVKGKETTYL